MNKGKINYQQGMLLKPQHFQLQDRLFDLKLQNTARLLQPYLYGCEGLEISSDALNNSCISVNAGTFLFADGACAVLGDNAVVASRQIPDELLESGELVSVYVALHKFSDIESNVAMHDGALPETEQRFVGENGGEKINDLYGSAMGANVEFLKYNLRIVFGAELDMYADFELLKIAEVYRDGSRILFNDDFAPPVVNLYGSPALRNIMNDISALIISKTRVFEKYKHLRNGSRITPYEISLMSIIRDLCLCSAEIQIMQDMQQVHPGEAWKSLAKIISVLSVNCDEISSVAMDSRYPPYRHDDLFGIFSLMRDQIRKCLNCLSVGPEYVIRFDRGENDIWNAKLPDLTKLDNYDIYLAMSGRNIEPDKLSLSFWRQLKLSSREDLKDLIVRSLPGIPIMVCDGMPGGLPALEQGFYSHVDRNNELWLSAVENRSLAMLWSAPEDAELALYVIRNY